MHMTTGTDLLQAFGAIVVVVIFLAVILFGRMSANNYIADRVSKFKESSEDKPYFLTSDSDHTESPVRHLRVSYSELEGEDESEKFISYVVKRLDERYGLKSLSSLMITEGMAREEIESLIKSSALESFNQQYGRSLNLDARFIAPRITSLLVKRGLLPGALESA